MDVSTAPLVTPDMTAERRLSTLLNLLIESGKLGGVDIGVFADRTSGPTIDSIVRPALADAGLTPRSVAVLNEDLDDLVSAESEIDVLVERWRSDGIDLLIVVGNNGNALIPDIRQALDIDVASDNLDVLRQLARPGRAGIEAFDGVLVLDRGRPSDVESAGPKLRRCLDTFQAANPDVEILARADVPPGGADWLIGVLDACAILAIFVAAAEAAGPELTNDSWQQGLETLNDFVVPGQQYSSFGPDKWDAHDGARLAEFRVEDLATRLEPLGELVDTAE